MQLYAQHKVILNFKVTGDNKLYSYRKSGMQYFEDNVTLNLRKGAFNYYIISK